MALTVQMSGMNNEKHNLENVTISNNSSTFSPSFVQLFLTNKV